MSGDWDDLLGELDDDQADDENEWGTKRALTVGTTLSGWWRGEEEWEGDYGRTPVYLMTDSDGSPFYFYGGRAQLDRRIQKAAPNPGDRVAIRRLEDAPVEKEGYSPAWRVRVAVRPGDGTAPAAPRPKTTPPGGQDDDIPF